MKNNKGFTPLPILKIAKGISKCKETIKDFIFKPKKVKLVRGFTFVELLTATVILAIVVAGVYAAFLSSAKFTNTFRHEVMAAISGQGALERVRAQRTWTDVSALNGQAVSIDWGALAEEVDGESAGNYSVSDVRPTVDGTTSPQAYRFRGITVRVKWDERQP